MAQNDIERNSYFNKMNDPLDNIFLDNQNPLNTAEISKSIFDSKNNSYNSSQNYKNSKSNLELENIQGYNYQNANRLVNNNRLNKNNNRNNQKRAYNKSKGNTTPNRSFLTKSKLSINSKNTSCYKNMKRKNGNNNYNYNYNKSNISNLNKNLRNNSPCVTYNNNFMRKDPNKESIIINKLAEEIEHIKNYCNELQRQFNNHCIIKNERKEFDNIKKENIKLTAEVSILKDDVAELMKKFSLINNKIDNIQQENNNLKIQNKHLLDFISIMNNSNNNLDIKRLKSFNMNSNNNNSKNLFSNNSNNESMNIINLINNNNTNIETNDKLIKNSSSKILNNNSNYLSNTNYNFNYNKNNNFNSEKIDFSISNSINTNEKLKEEPQDNNYRTINNFKNRNDYININSTINENLESKINKPYQTIEQTKKINNINNTKDNATDIVSLIQSNFNLTNQFKNNTNNNRQNRYLIPKNIE